MTRSIVLTLMLVVLVIGGSRLYATTTANPLTIELQKAVHFLTPSGDDIVLGPGTYEVEATEQGLRLKPKGGKPEDAKVIQAQALPHPETLQAPKAVAEALGEDSVRIALLLPEEKGLEAVGSFSGIRSRAPGTSGTNTALGTSALASNTTGSSNTGLGYLALRSNTTGSRNTATGTMALLSNTTGNGNTAFGTGALWLNTLGFSNTAVGADALNKNSSGPMNTAVGMGALQNTTTGGNSAVGAYALQANTTGSGNTSMGSNTLESNVGGSSNTAIGAAALRINQSGNHNTAVGASALLLNSSGGSNVAVGFSALGKNTQSRMNTALGYKALSELGAGEVNTAIGFGAGGHLTSGSYNLYIDNMTGEPTESNTIRIGRMPNGHQRAFIAGITGVAVSGVPVVVTAQGQLGVQGSSLRYKDDVQTMGEASQDLHKLRPVTFRYKPELAGKDATLEYGLIAEEVAKVYPDLVGHDADGAIVTVKYHELIPMLLNEVQQEHRANEGLRAELAQLSFRVKQLEAR